MRSLVPQRRRRGAGQRQPVDVLDPIPAHLFHGSLLRTEDVVVVRGFLQPILVPQMRIHCPEGIGVRWDPLKGCRIDSIHAIVDRDVELMVVRNGAVRIIAPQIFPVPQSSFQSIHTEEGSAIVACPCSVCDCQAHATTSTSSATS